MCIALTNPFSQGQMKNREGPVVAPDTTTVQFPNDPESFSFTSIRTRCEIYLRWVDWGSTQILCIHHSLHLHIFG